MQFWKIYGDGRAERTELRGEIGSVFREPIHVPMHARAFAENPDPPEALTFRTRDFVRADCQWRDLPAFVQSGSLLKQARMSMLVSSRSDMEECQSLLRHNMRRFVEEEYPGWIDMGYEDSESQNDDQRAQQIKELVGNQFALVRA